MSSEIHFSVTDSPIGTLGLAASSKGLVFLDFIDYNVENYSQSLRERLPGCIIKEDGKYIELPLVQIREYFQGNRKSFSCPLDLRGTDFQIKVWQTLQSIPFGELCSYQDIARKVNNPRGVRAVGQANGRNPVAIIVPCHRVIRKSGDLGGYSSGLDKKRYLLDWEENILKND
ncbi:MAG: methylated-DNA--[protein]-cysteine S-methyltransferase [Bacillota bacterium]